MIDDIIFSGGGLNCLTFIGVIRRLEELDIVKNIKKYSGISAGSIIVYFLVLGCSSDEMEEIFLELEFKKFKNFSIVNLIKFYGLDNCKNMLELLRETTKQKGYSENITFQNLYDITGKDLNIISFNLSKSEKQICNYTNSPDLEVIKSIQMSICIPFVFMPVVYNDDYYIDGGIYEFFPRKLGDNTLGVMQYPETFNPEIKTIFTFCFKILGYLTADKYNNRYRKNLIKVITNQYDFIDFNMTNEKKTELIQNGYNTALNFKCSET
jgi:hypothetical protein